MRERHETEEPGLAAGFGALNHYLPKTIWAAAFTLVSSHFPPTPWLVGTAQACRGVCLCVNALPCMMLQIGD